MKKDQSNLAILALLLVAIIWGSGFIATQYAIDAGMGTSLIMAIRFVLAATVILPFSLKALKDIDKKTLLHGSVAGMFLFFGFYAQTFGQAYTNVSNSAFLTATNVVMVPFIVWVISKKRPAGKTFVLAFTTLVGIAVLTIKPGVGFALGMGDMFTLLSALFFALHISYLGLFAKELNAIVMTFLQLGVSGIASLATLLIIDLDTINMEVIAVGLPPMVYLAVFSTCFCYYLQTKAQQYTTPSKAGIILCTEGLFGSLFSVLLGLEPLTASILVGGVIILTSVALTEADLRFLKKLKIKN